MRKILSFLIFAVLSISAYNQIDPLLSPYYQNGPYSVVMDSDMTATPNDLLFFRPSSSTGGPFPTVLFQPGANGTGTSYINKHSYDIYWQHLASYGFVVIIINNTAGGPNSTLFTQTHDYIKTKVNNSSHWMHSYVDLNKFIVAGHSNGGMNATDIIINRPSEIKAIIYMASYPNPGILGLGAQNVTNYNGKVMLMCGNEDDTSAPLVGATNDIASNAYQNKFTSVSCKTWVLFNGIGHGGFGNYNNPDQPVGSIGREPATASIRHYICSFLLSQFYASGAAYANLTQPLLKPSSVSEFQNTCAQLTEVTSLSHHTFASLFPNPANSYTNISFNQSFSGDCIIYNALGQEIEHFKLSNEIEYQIDLSQYNKGQYIIQFIDNYGLVSFSKLLKI
ncbi:MAG TPA: alpha/beta hydrolase [Bacteroidales bacterium]|jgi:pimeloyl-ACP methyl ester carboxylesterase|nr:alpha/beta hydrolase [Bacteroidales bacterium]